MTNQPFKRCKYCLEEIHTTFDGIEIDHADDCGQNPLQLQIRIFYDAKTRKFLIHRLDDPGKPYHPITQGAMIDLARNLRRYEEDWLRENQRLQ